MHITIYVYFLWSLYMIIMDVSHTMTKYIFCIGGLSHYSLQNFLPDLAVIEGMIPAHLHGTYNNILPEDIRAQLSVQFRTLTQGNMINTQHEA